MAFEAYLHQGAMRPTRGRRITYLISVVVHGAAVLAAVAYSFWRVEELSPPAVTVTLMSAAAAPPPPPPPPALGGGAAAVRHKATVRPKAEAIPKPAEVVAPRVEKTEPPPTPAPAPQEAAPDPGTEAAAPKPGPAGPGSGAGVKNGAPNGVAGGVVGGTGTRAAPMAKFLPPRMGEQQKLSGAQPDFPAHLAVAGARYLVLTKICVAAGGGVESVTLLKRAHPTLDNNVALTLKTWRFKPLMANGTPVPFCYVAQFEFKSE